MKITFTSSYQGKTFEAGGALDLLSTQFKNTPPLLVNNLKLELRVWLTEIALQLAAKHGNSWPNAGYDTLSKRSGDLVKSILGGVEVEGDSIGAIRGLIYGNEYINAHEYGITLSAHGARYLAIPLPTALNSNGTPIYASPRDWPNTFVGMSRLGNLLIFMRTSAHEVIPLYVLKTSVKLPARLGLYKMAEANLPRLMDRFTNVVASAFSGA